MAQKKIKTVLKLNLEAGKANPAPPIGPVLGQHGIPIMEFCTQYNAKTKDKMGQVIPALVTIYEDRTFTFVLKKAPVAEYIRKALKIQKGSSEPTKKNIKQKLTQAQLEEIAKEKMEDFNTKDIEAAKKTIIGTAHSMGVEIE